MLFIDQSTEKSLHRLPSFTKSLEADTSKRFIHLSSRNLPRYFEEREGRTVTIFTGKADMLSDTTLISIPQGSLGIRL